MEALSEDGCFVLRNVFDPELLGGIHDEALAFYRQLFAMESAEELAAAMGLPLDHVAGHFKGAKERGQINSQVFSMFFEKDAMALNRQLAASLTQRPLIDFIASVFGPDPVLHLNNIAVRYRSGDQAELALPWHQDCFYWDEPDILSGDGPVMLVISVPFTDCGKNRPGIEFIAKPMKNQLPITKNSKTRFGHLELFDRDIPADLADSYWYPELTAGDVFIFDERTIHRSFRGEGLAGDRTSGDLRVFSARRYPEALKGHVGWSLPSLEDFSFT